MKRLSHLFDRLFLVSLTGWSLTIFVYDLTHPEIWGDWKHNPKWSGPAAAIFVPLVIWVYVSSEHDRRRRERRHARLESTIRVVKDLYKAGRNREAEKAYSLYHRIRAAVSQREEDALAKEFSDMFSLELERTLS